MSRLYFYIGVLVLTACGLTNDKNALTVEGLVKVRVFSETLVPALVACADCHNGQDPKFATGSPNADLQVIEQYLTGQGESLLDTENPADSFLARQGGVPHGQCSFCNADKEAEISDAVELFMNGQ